MPAPDTGPTRQHSSFLTESECAYDFFQLVWLIERCCAPDVRVGRGGPREDECVIFRPDVSVGFPSTEVRSVLSADRAAGRLGFLVETGFLGLYGVTTPLPLHYSVDLLRDVAAASPDESTSTELRDFLDLLNHRLMSLFYRSGIKYRPERSFGLPGADDLTQSFAMLGGLPMASDEVVAALPSARLLRYLGLFVQRPRSAAGLESLLSDYWPGVNVSVYQFEGHWVSLRDTSQNRLGRANSGLADNMCLGDRIYDLGGTFRVRFGPLSWAEYLEFIPGGTCYDEARALVFVFVNDPLRFDLEMTLKPRQVPPLRLAPESDTAILGRTTWLRAGELDATSVIYRDHDPIDSSRGSAA